MRYLRDFGTLNHHDCAVYQLGKVANSSKKQARSVLMQLSLKSTTCQRCRQIRSILFIAKWCCSRPG